MVARGDREEALTRLDHVPCDRGPTRELTVCARPGDPVRGEPSTALIPTEGHSCAARESSVDGAWVESEAAKSELQHRNVPANCAHAELPLAEKRTTASAERSSCRAANAPGGPNAVLALERKQRARRQRAAHAVHRTSIESVSP